MWIYCGKDVDNYYMLIVGKDNRKHDERSLAACLSTFLIAERPDLMLASALC
jgi:hypothetical protein